MTPDTMWPTQGSQRYIRGSEQCGDRFAQAEPQRGPELAGSGQLVVSVYYKEFIAEGRNPLESPVDVKRLAGVDGTDKQCDYELTLPTWHFYTHISSGFGSRV